MFDLDISGLSVALMFMAFAAGIWVVNFKIDIDNKRQDRVYLSMFMTVITILASFGFLWRISNLSKLQTPTTRSAQTTGENK